MIEGINSSTTTTPVVNTYASTNTTQNKSTEQQSTVQEDTVEISEEKETKKSTYGTKPDSQVISKLISQSEATIANFKSLVEKIIVKQGKADTLGSFDLNMFSKNYQLKPYLQDLIANGIDQETIDVAKESVSEDGEFGIQKTAERILDFAKALIGGDVNNKNFEKIKDAVIKGFDAATSAWGDELPEISKKTKELVMNTFEQWEKNGNTNSFLEV